MKTELWRQVQILISPGATLHCWCVELVCSLWTWLVLCQCEDEQTGVPPSSPEQRSHSKLFHHTKLFETLMMKYSYRSCDSTIEHQESTWFCSPQFEWNASLVWRLPGGQNLRNSSIIFFSQILFTVLDQDNDHMYDIRKVTQRVV